MPNCLSSRPCTTSVCNCFQRNKIAVAAGTILVVVGIALTIFAFTSTATQAKLPGNRFRVLKPVGIALSVVGLATLGFLWATQKQNKPAKTTDHKPAEYVPAALRGKTDEELIDYAEQNFAASREGQGPLLAQLSSRGTQPIRQETDPEFLERFGANLHLFDNTVVALLVLAKRRLRDDR